MTPERLPEATAEYAEVCVAAGRPKGEVVVMGGLPLQDPDSTAEFLHGFREGGASRFVLFQRYADHDDFRRRLDTLIVAKEGAGL